MEKCQQQKKRLGIFFFHKRVLLKSSIFSFEFGLQEMSFEMGPQKERAWLELAPESGNDRRRHCALDRRKV